ncbi:MAG TPA: YcjX family protein, partial [Beijerinckiaceae bacterium]|nr:YcjX family protein [Beijerinckiaceae bacterium]
MASDSLTGWTEAARGASASLFDYLSSFSRPNLRIGVTGLSRAGKTVFITALVHALIGGGRLPVFRALSEGRISRARIAEQPDAAV